AVLLIAWGISLGVTIEPQVAAQAAESVREWKLGERTLALGSWGADVFTLQIQLREIGYTLQADGLFGKETQAVVRAFQRDQGLPETGVAGAATIERLALVRINRMETMPYI